MHGITTTRVGQLTHLDASGPYVSDIFWGAPYRLAFVDDFSRLRYIVPAVDRTWATAQAAFLEWCAFLHFWAGVVPAGLTCDNPPEYVSKESYEFTDDAAIHRLASTDYEPRSNGVAEATWRHLDPSVRAVLNTAIPGAVSGVIHTLGGLGLYETCETAEKTRRYLASLQ